MRTKKELIKIKENWVSNPNSLDFIRDFEELTSGEKALIFDMLVEEQDLSYYKEIRKIEKDNIFYLNWTKKEWAIKELEEELNETKNLMELLDIYKELGIEYIE